MVRATDFRASSKGVHCGSEHLVVHYRADEAADGETAGGPLVGFVVPKKELARSVDRHLVKRRLRHACRPLVSQLPPGARLVVRARSSCLQTSFSQLCGELESCLKRAQVKWGKRQGSRGV